MPPEARQFDRDQDTLIGDPADPIVVQIDDEAQRTHVRHMEVLYRLSTEFVYARDLESVYSTAITAVLDGLGADRASLLLFDDEGVLRFRASSGLSESYRQAVEGHSPWSPDSPDAKPILVEDVTVDEGLRPYLKVIRGEGIRSLAFFPLHHDGRVLGKFMAYFDGTHAYSPDEVRLSEMIANHLAMVIARRKAEEMKELLHAQLRRRLDELETMLDVVPVGVAVSHDPSGELITTNRVLAEILGVQPPTNASKIGHAADLLPFRLLKDRKEVPREQLPIYRAVHSGKTILNEELVVARDDGREVPLLINVAPLFDGSGKVRGALGAFIDMTEIKRAEKALQDLADALERRIAERTSELEAMNERLRNEVHERRRAEEQLARANTDLQASNRELQDFAYVASHDLQEPLRKIQSFAGLLRSDFGERLDEQGLFYIKRMQSAAGRMSDLIRGLLNYSRIHTQGHPFEQIDLKEVIRDVLSDLEISISEARGAVSTKSMPSLEADPTQMRQLFQNLIGNALKFRHSERAPVVRVACNATGEFCRIEVSDNGIGFAQQYADRIFSPFQRLHGRSAYPGTGMGLSICRRIVERHGGTITATGTPDEGATFTVMLPRKRDAWDTAPLPDVDDSVI